MMGLLLTLLILSLFTLFVLYLKLNHYLISQRLNTYLCHHFLRGETKSYIVTINRSNQLLVVLHLSRLVRPPTPHDFLIQQSIQRYQQVVHLSYLKKLVKNRYCKVHQGAGYLKSIPYKTVALAKLKRNALGLTELRKKRWTIIIPSTIPLRMIGHFFIIREDYQLPHNLSTSLLRKAREFSASKGVQRWRQLFGSLSSF